MTPDARLPGDRLDGPARRWQQLRSRLTGRLPLPITHVAATSGPETREVVSRRRRVVAATSVIGAGVLGVSLAAPPGSSRFYALTMGAAGTWTVGGLASGPLHLGWIEGRDRQLRRPWLTPVATGAGAFGFFYGCALVARRIPFLRAAIVKVLAYAEQGELPFVLATTYANAIGEEVFFRGALYAALPRRQAVVASTGVYALTTVTTRNPSLVLAAGVMGTLFGLQRRASGGLQAPLLTHVTWSTLMVRYLPPLFASGPDARGRR
jgi:membrane protease YdiL (CAAX protease family)